EFMQPPIFHHSPSEDGVLFCGGARKLPRAEQGERCRVVEIHGPTAAKTSRSRIRAPLALCPLMLRSDHGYGAASLASKSSSTRAQLGSRQNSCHAPVDGSRRKSYSIPRSFSRAATVRRSRALNAM